MRDLSRWKLVLGSDSDPEDAVVLNKDQEEVDELLNAIYGTTKKPGFGRSSHKIRKWLDAIRLKFPSDIVQILQEDALTRQGVQEMLLEPELLEKIEPSLELVAAILQLQQLMPDKSKAAAKSLVLKLVREIEKKLKSRLHLAVQNSVRLHSKAGDPNTSQIDWKKTIYRNLKNYRPEVNTIIPDKWFGFKKTHQLPQIILLVDKSESMVQSMIYASISGSILASLKSIQTHLIFFDTEITDLTNAYQDPVDILFSVPCGGGTDIARAMQYTQQQIRNVKECIIFLISDLYEYGNKNDLYASCNQIIQSGSKIISLLSLSDEGTPDYDLQIAKNLTALGVPCFACPPEKFPDLLPRYLNEF